MRFVNSLCLPAMTLGLRRANLDGAPSREVSPAKRIVGSVVLNALSFALIAVALLNQVLAATPRRREARENLSSR